MEHLRYRPLACWALDGTGTFSDISGYTHSAYYYTGSQNVGVSLSCFTAQSSYVDDNNVIAVQSPVYRRTREQEPFSIAISVYPVYFDEVLNEEHAIISHENASGDGITIEGTKVSFATAYENYGLAKCSFDVQTVQKMDIVATHTDSKNTLFINGVLVAEVDITADQKEDEYNAPSDTLLLGYGSGEGGLLVNCLALYPHALLTEEVNRLYVQNNRRTLGTVPKAFHGEDIYVSTKVRASFLNTGWYTNAEWNEAYKENVNVENNRLLPQTIGGLTTSGLWQDSVDLYVGQDPIAIDSINMFWYGENVNVEASIDAENWVPVTKGVNLSNIPTGFDPTGKDLHIRVTFTPGVETGFIDTLSVQGYLTANASPPNGHTITYNNPAVAQPEQIPGYLKEDWGVKLLGGSIEIGEDTSGDPIIPKTLEIWVRKFGSADPDISSNVIGAEEYANGLPGSGIRQGEWVLKHYVVPGGISGPITIGGHVQVGKVAVYPDALTDTDIRDIYLNYVSTYKLNVNNTGAIGVSIPSGTTGNEVVKVTEHDWSTV